MSADYIDQSYYPRAALHLIVRLEEFQDEVPLRKLAPTSTTKNLNGTSSNRSGLAPYKDPSAPSGVTRYIISSGTPSATSAGPQSQIASIDKLTFHVMCIPKEVSWSQNGLRNASTLNATIKWSDLPLEPRVIRSLGVELLLGCIDEDTMAKETSSNGANQGAPIIPFTYTGPYNEPRTNLRFQGFANEMKINWDESEPVIHLECRDNLQLLIDQEWSIRTVINATLPLDLAVATYLSNFVQFEGLSVEYRPNTDTPPVFNTFLCGTAMRPGLGPHPSKGGGSTGASAKMSALDYLTEQCGKASHYLRMDGNNLIIQRPRSILASASPRPDDPFRPRTDASGQTYASRRMIYGRNIEKVEIKREFSKKVATNVEVCSYVPENKVKVVGRFPRVSSDPTTNNSQLRTYTGSTQPDQKWTVYEIAGVKSQAMVNQIAQDTYEGLSRQEIAIDLSTKNLSSFGGGNPDPDILDMKFGDEWELQINREQNDTEHSVQTSTQEILTNEGRCSAWMVHLGFPNDFADAYAKAYTSAAFQYQFRMHTMKVDWGGDEGCKLQITGVNYIQVRSDLQLPVGLEPSNTSQNVVAPQPATSTPTTNTSPNPNVLSQPIDINEIGSENDGGL